MKKTLVLSALFGLLFFSCKKEEKQPSTEETKFENPPPTVAATQECYEYIQGKDTIQAQLMVENGIVTGSLDYKLFEKDKNTGRISGVIQGDTLLAEYTFMSEGVTSIRQVAFLRKNKSLIECYGESLEKDGKMMFKDSKNLNFGNSVTLNEIPCK